MGPRHQHRLDRRPDGTGPAHRAHHCLQHHERRPGELHPRPRRRVGAARHHRQRHLPGLLPLENDPGDARHHRRADPRLDADQAPGKRRGPERAGGAARLRGLAPYHRAGDRRRRRSERDMSSDAKLAFTRDYQKRIPFVSHLKILTETLGEGTARLSLPIEPHLTNSIGTVHGGVIMSLLDVALCTAARTLHPDSLGVITIDMSTSFIGGGSGARLLAEARVLKNGRSMIFVDGEAKNEDGSLGAKAIGTERGRLKDREPRGGLSWGISSRKDNQWRPATAGRGSPAAGG